jgi:hypothetical protein
MIFVCNIGVTLLMQTEGGLEASYSDLLDSRIDLGLRGKGLQLPLRLHTYYKHIMHLSWHLPGTVLSESRRFRLTNCHGIRTGSHPQRISSACLQAFNHSQRM